jgi:hypothetical protein
MRPIVYIFFLLPLASFGQTPDSIPPHHNAKRLRHLVIGSASAYSASVAGLYQLWYKDTQRQSFTFFNDNAEWKQVDKAGHFFSAFQISHGSSAAWKWAGFRETKSDLLGALTAFAVLLPIEVFDGHSEAYGASVGDLAANAGGALFFLGQKSLWGELRVIPKFSAHRTTFASKRPELLGNDTVSRLLKDYNGQTYWLSFDADKFLAFPKWLNIAVGYGAQGMIYGRDQENIEYGLRPNRQYYLSVDFDLSAIKTGSKALKALIFVGNMIKIPAPALELSSAGTRFHFLYF